MTVRALSRMLHLKLVNSCGRRESAGPFLIFISPFGKWSCGAPAADGLRRGEGAASPVITVRTARFRLGPIRLRLQWFASVAAALTGLTAMPAATAPASLDPAAEKSVRGFLSTYCVECHGPDKQKADRRFDGLRLSIDSPDSLHDLQEMLDVLNLGDMPPEEAKRRPDAAEVRQQVAQLTALVAEGQARLSSTGGRTVLRRLNRREYLNTVGDLFGVNMTLFNPATNFPRDEMVEQLDNVGDTLRTSGFLLAQYLDAGEQVVQKAFEQVEQPCETLW